MAYLIPPILAVWGVYCVIKLEFNFQQWHVKGAMAVLAGLGLVAVGALFFAVNLLIDKYFFEKYGRDDN